MYLNQGQGTYMTGMVNSVPLLKVGRKKTPFSVPLDDLMSSN